MKITRDEKTKEFVIRCNTNEAMHLARIVGHTRRLPDCLLDLWTSIYGYVTSRQKDNLMSNPFDKRGDWSKNNPVIVLKKKRIT